MKSCSFILVAAGKGERAGGSLPKQFRLLGGRPLWEWSFLAAEKLHREGEILETVLVVPPGREDDFRRAAEKYSCPFSITEGGSERSASVRSGVGAAEGEYVLIHDAARPFLSVSLCRRLLEVADPDGGAVPLLAAADAMKCRDKDGNLSAFPREGLFLTQTPQIFPTLQLKEVLERYGRGAKDEAEAWIDSGRELRSVEGERKNMKITWEEDFTLAEALFSKTSRTGVGYDIHPLVPDRTFILGGVPFPDFPLGFRGYSDGDVLVHTLCDALLGAAGLGDIGLLYPAGEIKYHNISSLLLLEDVGRRVYALGWSLEWFDGVICAQEPRLAPFLPAMIAAMEGVLPPEWQNRLHLKAKSGERTGTVGECGAVVCSGSATLSIPSWLLAEGKENRPS